MRRYNIADLTDDDLRRLRMLVRMERAAAHIVVRTDYAWPIPIQTRGSVRGRGVISRCR